MKFGDTTGKQKQYVSDEESTSSGEEKEGEDEYKVEDNDNDCTDGGVIKKEDCSNEASSKTKNIQKASTLPSKRQLTVMETLQINKMKQDKEAGDKKKERKENVAKTLLGLQQKSHIFCNR